MTRGRYQSALFTLFILAFTLLYGCKSEHEIENKEFQKLPTVPVSIITATESFPARQVEVMGTVQAADRASIAARISGNITEMPVKPGSRVKQGDLLLSISAGEISAKLLQAQAQFEQADRNLKRERNLLKKNAATPETVKTLEESRRIAEAAYKEARTMLSYTSIKAPFDGVVTRKIANIGDLATPGKPLLQLENESRLQIVTDIPEALILGISIGDTLPVNIQAAELNITGEVTEIAPVADPKSRTATVKLTIPHGIKIRSGQFARIALPGARGMAIMVPESAVLSFGQMERVFVVREDIAYMQLVKTGLRHGDQLEVLSGISPGDTVISTGNKHLRDGQPVTTK